MGQPSEQDLEVREPDDNGYYACENPWRMDARQRSLGSRETMSRRRAALSLLVALLAFGVLATVPTPDSNPARPGKSGDVAMYQEIVSRLRTGEAYYDVLGEELRRRHYATREVFNWRTPLLWSVLADVPDAAARGALIVLGVLLFGMTLATTLHQSPWITWGSAIMQAGAIAMVTVPSAMVMAETWSGILIGLSLCMYGCRRSGLAVPLGVLALFVRELAAPYCVGCSLVAAVNRRWREVGAWFGGACLYAAYYGWHLVNIREHRLPTDLAHASSWLELGGVTSLLMKARWQAWLLPSPRWATAVALTILGVGVCAMKTPTHVRLASAVYVGFFLVAGKPFDGYWGLIAWPTWALACGYGIQLMWERARRVVSSAERL